MVVEAPIGPVTPSSLAAYVEAKARALASSAYAPPSPPLADAIAALDYDAYRRMRVRPEGTLWRGESRFEVLLTHPGAPAGRGVRIHLVEEGEVGRAIPFDPARFEYDRDLTALAAALPAESGYGGFRVLYPLNEADKQDEVIVFQGAAYFRMLGPGHVHGVSARGLGVDIGGEEEFPDFTEFWLVRPEPSARALTFHGLLDSPSVTGAYTFVLEPGAATVLTVDARLFARRDVSRLGVAPLSSMFLHGPTRAGSFDDFRPEVHDSDGLLMRTGHDEWIWRPLSNRRTTVVTALLDGDPRGFGLLQRARDFDRYLDLEARYDRRPGVWVRPLDGGWGPGAVQLLELPTDSEFRDNIAAAWVPDTAFRQGDERRYRYELVTVADRVQGETLHRVERTRIGRDGLPGEASPRPRSHRRFVIDFMGGWARGEPAGAIRPVLESSSGRIADLRTERLPSEAGWRVSFRLEPDGERPADMRLRLMAGDERLSETWSYVWYPSELSG